MHLDFFLIKLNEGNATKTTKIANGENWGKCFTAKIQSVDVMIGINFESHWIIHFVVVDIKYSPE